MVIKIPLCPPFIKGEAAALKNEGRGSFSKNTAESISIKEYEYVS
jgi:hypothetical protein